MTLVDPTRNLPRPPGTADLFVGEVAADGGDVQPHERLSRRVADQARTVRGEALGLGHRASRSGDDAPRGVVRQVARAPDGVWETNFDFVLPHA